MKRIGVLITLFCMTLFFYSCQNNSQTSSSTASIDIRSGYNFYHIVFNKGGVSYSIKGKGSYESEIFKIESIKDSVAFETNSLDEFLNVLNEYEQKPLFESKIVDAARIEIYKNENKIYDSYSWNSDFWKLVKPIMNEIPDKVNPFIRKKDF